MMTETAEQDSETRLQQQLARRNWIILGFLVAASLFWKSAAVTAGVAGGGIVAIIAFSWMRRSLSRAIGNPLIGNAQGRYQLSFFIRLAFVGTAIFVLIAVLRVNPIALVAGLSVMVFNIVWLTIHRIM
ncbi:MAG: ATP synthase subunit I [Geoalkalibacter sp.]|jgi:hypothetical protein|uniref:ATP synthase subunit I n=1 Tax=Geoalkalibacter sp. TaxID=3041440 RepID=UPI002A9DA5AC|nr:ATP synthase subunit I [Thermodesulfobacteriota bacterium]